MQPLLVKGKDGSLNPVWDQTEYWNQEREGLEPYKNNLHISDDLLVPGAKVLVVQVVPTPGVRVLGDSIDGECSKRIVRIKTLARVLFPVWHG